MQWTIPSCACSLCTHAPRGFLTLVWAADITRASTNAIVTHYGGCSRCLIIWTENLWGSRTRSALVKCDPTPDRARGSKVSGEADTKNLPGGNPCHARTKHAHSPGSEARAGNVTGKNIRLHLTSPSFGSMVSSGIRSAVRSVFDYIVPIGTDQNATLGWSEQGTQFHLRTLQSGRCGNRVSHLLPGSKGSPHTPTPTPGRGTSFQRLMRR